MIEAGILAGVCVGLVTYAAVDAVTTHDRRTARVLRGLSSYEIAAARSAQPTLRPFYERVLQPLVRRVSTTMRSSGLDAYRSRLAHRLLQAGRPNGLDLERLLVIKIAIALVVAFLALPVALTSLLARDSATVAIAVAFIAAGFFAPDLWLGGRVSERQKQIQRALPDMLDMLTVSVEAGLGFDSALGKLARKTEGPLAEEFGHTLREIHAGVARKDALRHLAERTDVRELKTFVMAMIQADVFGVSVSRILRTQSQELRTRRRQRAEEAAQTAPVKLVFPLLLCLLPATLIVVVGPAILSLAQLISTMGGG